MKNQLDFKFRKLTLKRKIGLLFVVLLLMPASNYFLISLLENSLEETGTYVDIARENSLHVQRAVFFARNAADGRKVDIHDVISEVKKTDRNLELLQNGGLYKDPNFGDIELRPTPPELMINVDEVSNLWREFRKNLLFIAESKQQLDTAFQFVEKINLENPPLGFDVMGYGINQTVDEALAQADSAVGADTGFIDDELDVDSDLLAFDDEQSEPRAVDRNADVAAERKESTVEVIFGSGDGQYRLLKKQEKMMNPEIKPALNFILRNAEQISLISENLVNVYFTKFINEQRALRSRIGWLLGLNVLIIVLIYRFTIRSTLSPLELVTENLDKLSHGDLSAHLKLKRQDEVGAVISSVNVLTQNLSGISSFAINVGDGNFEYPFKVRSEKDELGFALLDMRDNLKKNAEEDRRRNWINEGMATFGEILRKHSDDLDILSYKIISQFVQYLGANQGGLFLLEETSREGKFLSLKASYAYNKRKYLEKKIPYGNTLISQALIEEGTIYLHKVPEDYVRITSGIGEATPSVLLIVPLMVNEQAYGAIEIAAFSEFMPYQIEFAEKLSESIAATMAATQANQRTKALLEESQMFAQQMGAQEEEMRQNMEELTATQEEMERVQADLQSKERELSLLVNSSHSLILMVSKDYTVKFVSDNYVTKFKSMYKTELRPGMNYRNALPSEVFSSRRAYYKRALAGESFSVVISVKDKDYEDSFFEFDFNPVIDKEEGKVQGFSLFIKDITWLEPVRWTEEHTRSIFREG